MASQLQLFELAKFGRGQDKKESTKWNLEITEFFASETGQHFDVSLYPPYGNFNTGDVHLGGTKIRKLRYHCAPINYEPQVY